jgi:predicted anti-sigma-YlaC factor YlaD
VCEILSLTAENQRVLLHQARAKVRAALEAYYQQTREAVEEHLRTCEGCRVYMDQMRETSEDLPDQARRNLLDAFRAENPR